MQHILTTSISDAYLFLLHKTITESAVVLNLFLNSKFSFEKTLGIKWLLTINQYVILKQKKPQTTHIKKQKWP